jgi:hypothetical protein
MPQKASAAMRFPLWPALLGSVFVFSGPAYFGISARADAPFANVINGAKLEGRRMIYPRAQSRPIHDGLAILRPWTQSASLHFNVLQILIMPTSAFSWSFSHFCEPSYHSIKRYFISVYSRL